MINRRGIFALVGAIGFALALLSAAAAQSGDAIPGGIYIGIASGDCPGPVIQAGPDVEFQLNSHGTAITTFTVTDLVTPLGDFERLGIPVDIAIDEDGSFDEEFDPLNLGLALVHLEGRFEGESVSGSFNIEVDGTVQCSGTFIMEGSLPPERPSVLFLGTLDDVDRDCGGGDIDVTVSGNRLSVIAVDVRNLNVHGTPVSASATFGEGTVPIAEDGSFGWTYFPGEVVGQEIAVIGTVSFAFFSGGLTVSPSECGAIPFSGVSPQNLGQGGAGPTSSGNSLAWLAVLAAVGAALLGLGAASLAKR
ncbi:MAG: hypothetical protein IIC91_05695 [Chloroflexi bacterium]|nr:hypothetical protein [Chloroflexota bacterium]